VCLLCRRGDLMMLPIIFNVKGFDDEQHQCIFMPSLMRSWT
jgi:hypothetical protein